MVRRRWLSHALLVSVVGAALVPAAAGNSADAQAAPVATVAVPASEARSAAVTSSAPGRTDVFTRSSNGDLVYQFRQTGGSWSRPVNLGGDLASQPAAVSWGPGRLDVFARGTDNALWHRWSNSGTWSSWRSMGGYLRSAPGVASSGSGLLDVVTRGRLDALELWMYRPGIGWGNTLPDLAAGLTSSPAVTSWGPGRLHVVARGPGNVVRYTRYDPTVERWSAWRNLGGTATSQPVIVSPGEGLLDVVVRGSDNAMWRKRLVQGTWSTWRSIGGSFTSGPGAHAVGDDVRVVGLSTNGYYRESVRSYPGGSWSAWTTVDQYLPFRRLGTWVDTLDYGTLTRNQVATRVADMKARGVRTLYLSTARFNRPADSAADFYDQEEIGWWLDEAHARGVKVVGWYVPAYGDMPRDVRRTVAIGTFVSPTGQRFDAVGVDIERFGTEGEVDKATFNARLVTHLTQVRARTPAVIAAIVPSPFTTDPGNRWSGFPWSSIGPRSEVVVPMALWSYRSDYSASQVYTWVKSQVDRTQALTGRRVHVEGGVIGEGSTPVTAARVQAFVDAAKSAGAIGGSQYDYATMAGHTSFWPILAGLNTL